LSFQLVDGQEEASSARSCSVRPLDRLHGTAVPQRISKLKLHKTLALRPFFTVTKFGQWDETETSYKLRKRNV